MAADTLAEAELRELNRRSFQAEDSPEDAATILEPLLSSDFSIVRARGVVQNRQQMIDQARNDTTGRLRRLEEEQVRVYGDAAVARTLLTLLEPGGQEVGRYWNTKVFVRQEPGWKCIAWHVTQVEQT
jgi:ketosteroid isomerase-like protein